LPSRPLWFVSPMDLSFAETFQTPLASMSKVTSNLIVPLGPGGRPC
jgi:hypothetical protein